MLKDLLGCRGERFSQSSAAHIINPVFTEKKKKVEVTFDMKFLKPYRFLAT